MHCFQQCLSFCNILLGFREAAERVKRIKRWVGVRIVTLYGRDRIAMALAPCMQWDVVPCPRSSDRSWKGVVFISHVRREGVAMRGDGYHAL